jgi:hypothetical protein
LAYSWMAKSCLGIQLDGKRKVGMDLDRVLLLLAKSFEGYSSSRRSLRYLIRNKGKAWDWIGQFKEKGRCDAIGL